MSINIFKKHPGNKVTFSNRAILSGELIIMGSRPKMIFCVIKIKQVIILVCPFAERDASAISVGKPVISSSQFCVRHTSDTLSTFSLVVT